MPFEELDNKAREAASQYHPPYNEHAWGRMEKLLDTHLPLSNDQRKRRGLLWLLPAALLLGGGAWLFTAKPWQPVAKQEPAANFTPGQQAAEPGNKAAVNRQAATSTATTPESNAGQPTDKNVPAPAGDDTDTDNINNSGNNTSATSNPPAVAVNGKNSVIVHTTKPVTGVKQRQKSALPLFATPVAAVTNNRTKSRKPKNDKQDDKLVTVQQETISPVQNEAATTAGKATPVINEPAVTPVNTPPAVEKQPAAGAQQNQQPKTAAANKKKNTGGKFSISISAGLDVSQVSNGRLGSFRPLFGAGIGYSITPRLLLRTGIYTTDKIYAANPADYKPDAPINYPGYDLTNVSASCRVLQAPVTLSYLLPAGSGNNLLLSAGVASVWMKKEVYVYDFKSTYGGYNRSHTYTYNNENRHLFSMLSLSTGFQRSLGSRFSILAEPYITLPLNGIGNGNVQLKSAGLQVSVSMAPFKKK